MEFLFRKLYYKFKRTNAPIQTSDLRVYGCSIYRLQFGPFLHHLKNKVNRSIYVTFSEITITLFDVLITNASSAYSYRWMVHVSVEHEE